MNTIHRLIGFTLGILLSLYAGNDNKKIKFLWLSHYLIGSGKSKVIPQSVAQHWNDNLVRHVKDNQYLIRPFPSELFWLVGSMIVTIADDRVIGKDIYDFHQQSGQNVIHGADRSLQWAYSGGKSDSTQIKVNWFILMAIRALSLSEFFKVEDDRLLVSNGLWPKLGGKPFESLLEVSDKG